MGVQGAVASLSLCLKMDLLEFRITTALHVIRNFTVNSIFFFSSSYIKTESIVEDLNQVSLQDLSFSKGK